MTDLVEFLRARLDEDEHEARAAIEERQRVNPIDGEDFVLVSWPDLSVPAVVIGPERLLAEVEAKRRIIGIVTEQLAEVEGYAIDGGMEQPGVDALVLRALALPYADHPDYRPDWVVGTVC